MTYTSTLQGEGAASAPTHLNGAFLPEKSKLFWLALWTGALTIVTFGIYRFWARTRLRRYIWSSTKPGGDSFEYTGTGLEKFLGFLIALVVIMVYSGILQVVLDFIGYNLWGEVISGPNDSMDDALIQTGLTYGAGLAILPLIFFAQYRARRYMMSRTRWRGLRFAMDAAALGYTWRVMLYFAAWSLSFGLLTPLATFRLEKYMTDRMWYGDARFEQTGQWTALYAAMKHQFIAVGVLLLGAAIIYFGQAVALGGTVMIAGGLWLIFGFVYYQVESFKYLTAHKVLDGKVHFTSNASSARVIRIFVLGVALIAVLVVGLIIAFGALFGLFALAGGGLDITGGDPWTEIFAGIGLVAGLGAIFGSLVALVCIGAFVIVFISAPILGHYVDTFRVENAEPLEQIRQRAGDNMVDADGFADALDVGGAF